MRGASEKDWDIIHGAGIRQTYGENGGPGSLSHTLRNVPMLEAICRDVEELAPHAMMINFINPEARICTFCTGTRSSGSSGFATRFTSVRLRDPRSGHPAQGPEYQGCGHQSLHLDVRHPEPPHRGSSVSAVHRSARRDAGNLRAAVKAIIS